MHVAAVLFQQACILQTLYTVDALVSATSNETSAPDTSLWPVAYLHFPKTAGNFATTVIHTGCSREGIHIPKSWSAKDPGDWREWGCWINFNFRTWKYGHAPLHLPTEQDYLHVVTLFREPYQRLMSGYFHGRHDCPDELHRVAPSCHSENSGMTSSECLETQDVTLSRVERYAECAGSCQTHMVFDQWCNGTSQGCFVDLSELATVHARIDHMGFVGLTDQYDLSVCLFHARFGGSCEAVEFSNRRPGTRHNNHGYDVPQSERLRHLLKDELATYEAAQGRFWKDVRNFGVGRSFCQRLCPNPPDVFGISPSLFKTTQVSDFEYDWPGRLSFDVDSFD